MVTRCLLDYPRRSRIPRRAQQVARCAPVPPRPCEDARLIYLLHKQGNCWMPAWFYDEPRALRPDGCPDFRRRRAKPHMRRLREATS